jgi:hypothetical protein
MDRARLEELKADIEKNGQYVEIVLCDGMILDGRNRYEACTQLQIEPDTTDFVGDPWAFAWSLNGARRDLDATVRALIFRRCEDGSAKWAKRLEKVAADGNAKRSEAAKEQHAKSKPRHGETLVVDHNDPPPNKKHVVREARAAEAKVSPATMAVERAFFSLRSRLAGDDVFVVTCFFLPDMTALAVSAGIVPSSIAF